jgi:hypothetical protein
MTDETAVAYISASPQPTELMPVAETGQIRRLDGVPRRVCLADRHMDAADSARVLVGVAVVESHAKAVEVNVVQVSTTDFPFDVCGPLCRGHCQIEVLFK